MCYIVRKSALTRMESPYGIGLMRLRNNAIWLAMVALLLAAGVPAFAVSKEMVQLQTQVQALQDQVARMQQANDMNMGVMKNLIEQSADSINKMNATVNDLQNKMQGLTSDNSGKLDQLSGQIQSLHDSVDELKSRLAKVSKQLDDMQAGGQNLAAGQPGITPAPGGAPPATAPPGGGAGNAAPPADVLYNNALRDYNSGKYDLSSQEFAQYLQYYASTDLAGNAQFYLADIEYRQGNFEAAVKDYDKVLEQYPGGSKAAAAELKKGYALLELGQRDAGVRELNSLISRYPRSIEASQARDRLRRLGVASGTVHKPAATNQ
jgi:tol-pal system protein YbgF